MCFSDINECATGTHNCSADAACSNTEGSYNCTCKPGFYGDGRHCEPGKVGYVRRRMMLRGIARELDVFHVHFLFQFHRARTFMTKRCKYQLCYLNFVLGALITGDNGYQRLGAL